jgi:hypothetical protein
MPLKAGLESNNLDIIATASRQAPLLKSAALVRHFLKNHFL